MGEEDVSAATTAAGEEDVAPPVAVAGSDEDEEMVPAAAAVDLDPVAAAAAAVAAATSASLEGLVSPVLAMERWVRYGERFAGASSEGGVLEEDECEGLREVEDGTVRQWGSIYLPCSEIRARKRAGARFSPRVHDLHVVATVSAKLSPRFPRVVGKSS